MRKVAERVGFEPTISASSGFGKSGQFSLVSSTSPMRNGLFFMKPKLAWNGTEGNQNES
jgi:hypothetical protein